MKPEVLIRQFLKRKKMERPGYSMRALARDLDCSVSFVSEVLSGKKKVPPAWIKSLGEILDFDAISLADLKAAVLTSHLAGTGLEELLDASHITNHMARRVSKVNLAKPLDNKKVSVLTKWYYVAVLDFLTLETGPFSDEDMARRLDLSVAAIREALTVLERLGLIAYDASNRPYKTDLHIRYPTSRTDPAVRGFHVQMIEKAKYEVMNKTKDSDFAKRLITASTMAVDPAHTEKIKEKLQDFLAEIADEYSKGQAEELYQLNIQLFPLTK